MEYNNYFVFLLYIMVPAVIIGGRINSDCHETLSNGKVKFFCCDNHEEVEGECVECKIGFISTDGLPCEPCPYGWWGRKCKQKCTCNKESCHHVEGCIESDVSTKQPNEGINGSTSSYIPVTAIKREDGFTTDRETEGVNRSNTLFLVVYSVCGLLSVGFCFVCSVFMIKKTNISLCLKVERRTLPLPDVQNSSHAYIDVVDERPYDLIDEEAIGSENGQSQIDEESHINNEEESESGHSVEMSEIGLQNPYEPIIETAEIHKYKSLDNKSDHIIVLHGMENENRASYCASQQESSTDSEGYVKPVSSMVDVKENKSSDDVDGSSVRSCENVNNDVLQTT